MHQRMILITYLDIWTLTGNAHKPGIGNQSLYNTLLGYARAGYEVHMLTTSTMLSRTIPVHDRVHIHRGPMLVQRLRRAWSRVKGAFAFWHTPAPLPPARPNTSYAICTPEQWRLAQAFRYFMGRRAIRLAAKLGGVDFIYGHEIFGALAGEKAAKRLGVPLITRFQGTELGQFLDNDETLLACRTHVAAARVDADMVIMADDGTRGDEVLRRLGVPEERWRFWMNGVVKDDVYRPNIDTAAIRRRLGIAADEVFLLYTGRMFYWKRVDRLLEVLKRVSESFRKFKAVIVGDGPEMAAVQAMCHELGLDHWVSFAGAMSHSEVMDYLNACDVYVSFHDLTNLCNPSIESCVCGKCIVTTAIGGTRHLLTDDVDAIVLPQHDNIEAISAALLRVLEDPQERARLARGAFERGKQLKTWEERMQLEVSDVEEIVSRRSGHPAVVRP